MRISLIVVCLALSGCLHPVLNSCIDGVRNGDESAIDCGGSCAACANGQTCFSSFDCLSGFCNNGICSSTSTCRDGLRNGNESDVDCGGSCPACRTGYACLTNFDCA